MSNNLSLFDLFLIDIETVPQTAAFSQLPVDSQKLFFDKIPKTVPEKTEEEAYEQKAGIMAEFGKVICISVGYFHKDNDSNVCLKVKSIYGHDEKSLLSNFQELADKFFKHNPRYVFAGHNIREFDIPFLCRRFIIQRLQLPHYMNYYGAKPWEVNMVDTLQWWRFGDYKNYTSLHLLASVLAVPTSKDDIDGSMVQHVYYKDNDLERIARYCEKDIVLVARVIQRLKNMEPIEDRSITKSL